MKRRNPVASQLVRGFLIGAMYERGHTITTERLRRELRVSKATAKRDFKALRAVAPVRGSKPVEGLRCHIPQVLRKAA